MKRNYMLKLCYDGTRYCGWQIQPDVRTVQGELTKALETITRSEVEVVGVSRTDAGVHALCYVCSCHMDTSYELSALMRSINGILEKDIRLTEISYCDDSFNARYDAVAKTYIYTIDNTYWGDPFLRNTSWHWGKMLDFEKMQIAAEYFIGTHDFSSFMSAGGSAVDFTRTIYTLNLEKNNGIIKLKITGNGFLYNMVRIITGTLLLVGSGKVKPEEIKEIILKKDRKFAGITAPPQGLALARIYYSKEELECLLKSHLF